MKDKSNNINEDERSSTRRRLGGGTHNEYCMCSDTSMTAAMFPQR